MVIYSRLGEKADSVIKRIITSEKKQWIVITSDRDIADYAWARKSVVVSSEEFLDVLDRAKGEGDIEYLEEGEYVYRKKGSARRLSMKEKAKKRAIRKL
jgi:predicted RNA-binding protein with PIN domain